MRRHGTQIFTTLFPPLVTLLTLLTVFALYRYGSAPTDENWFQDSPSTVMVARAPAGTGAESGDLLVGVNGVRIRTREELDAALPRARSGERVTVKLFRPATGMAAEFPLDAAILRGDALRTIPTAAHVFDIIEEGASDRAGMKVGDLIVRINGKTFASSGEADAIMRQGLTGGVTEYVVLRGLEERTLRVTLASFGLQFPVIVLFLCGVLWMGTGAFLGFARPWLPGARLLALFFLCLGYTFAVSFIQRDRVPDVLSTLRGISLVFCAVYGMAFGIHAMWHFPFERPVLRRDRWIIIFVYLFPVLLLASLVVLRDRGNPFFFGGLSFLGLSAAAVGFMLKRRAGASERREVARVLRLAGIAAGAGTLLVAVAVIFLFRGRGPAQLSMGFIGLPLALIPLGHLYTIGRYRLLDLKLRVRRTFQYSLASAAWVALVTGLLLWGLHWLARVQVDLPYVRVTAGSIEYIGRDIPPELQVIAQKTFVLAAGLAMAALAWFVLRRGKAWIASRFHRSGYDYRRAASELAEVMATNLTMDDLARGVVAKLSALMQLKRAGVLFFRDEQACCCRQAHGLEEGVWKEFCLRNDAALAHEAAHRHAEFAVRTLEPPLRDELLANEFEYVVPVHSQQRLVGALLIGEKQSESVFAAEDLEFLGAVAKQASVAVENAFLYEELAEQERLKHELAIARRIQMESLPQTTPHVAGLEIAGRSIPAKEVGGDYFDYLNGNGRELTVVIGDVSGKGTSAALYMAKIQGILRSLHAFDLAPTDLFVRTNNLLCRDLEKKSFVTALSASFDPVRRRTMVARAGHLPLYVFRKDTGSVERVLSRGLGLGISPEQLFENEMEARVLGFAAGDVFLFVTDGVTEAQDRKGAEFGEERLTELLRGSADRGAGAILSTILDAVAVHEGGGEQHDDQTVVVVKAVRNGAAAV